jgi:NagD protein
MTERKPIESWLTDMDGVLMHEGVPVPGADAFIKKLRESGKPFLVLTNNSIYTARDLQARLNRIGLDVPVQNIWTSALATAKFLDTQHPGGTAYVIGEAGLTTALHDAGYVLTDSDPDFVILGETRTY